MRRKNVEKSETKSESVNRGKNKTELGLLYNSDKMMSHCQRIKREIYHTLILKNL